MHIEIALREIALREIALRELSGYYSHKTFSYLITLL